MILVNMGYGRYLSEKQGQWFFVCLCCVVLCTSFWPYVPLLYLFLTFQTTLEVIYHMWYLSSVVKMPRSLCWEVLGQLWAQRYDKCLDTNDSCHGCGRCAYLHLPLFFLLLFLGPGVSLNSLCFWLPLMPNPTWAFLCPIRSEKYEKAQRNQLLISFLYLLSLWSSPSQLMETIFSVTWAKNLGVIFDSSLSLIIHIQTTRKACWLHLQNICRLWILLSPQCSHPSLNPHLSMSLMLQ